MFEDIVEKIQANKVIAGLIGLLILVVIFCFFLLGNPSKSTQEELLPSWSGQSESLSSAAISSEKTTVESDIASSRPLRSILKGQSRNLVFMSYQVIAGSMTLFY